jgi:hypothetical protein
MKRAVMAPLGVPRTMEVPAKRVKTSMAGSWYLAHALELADGEALEAYEFGWVAARQAEPEELVLGLGLSGTASPLVAAKQWPPPEPEPLVTEPVGVLENRSSARVPQGSTGPR